MPVSTLVRAASLSRESIYKIVLTAIASICAFALLMLSTQGANPITFARMACIFVSLIYVIQKQHTSTLSHKACASHPVLTPNFDSEMSPVGQGIACSTKNTNLVYGEPQAPIEPEQKGQRGGFYLLLALLFPIENYWSSKTDYAVQWLTANLSRPFSWLGGLPLELDTSATNPTLTADIHQLFVEVTPECAGAQTMLILITLGVVGAEIFLRGGYKWMFIALCPLIGFSANVVRIVISVFAANRWGDMPQIWFIAHDVIGFGVFFLTYGMLFLLAWRFRKNNQGLSPHF